METNNTRKTNQNQNMKLKKYKTTLWPTWLKTLELQGNSVASALWKQNKKQNKNKTKKNKIKHTKNKANIKTKMAETWNMKTKTKTTEWNK